MYDRMHTFSPAEIQKIHDATISILDHTGVAFNAAEALEIFKRHGKKIDGNIVFLREADVLQALASAPQSFVIHARNSTRDVTVGGDHFVYAPGYGAPFVVAADGDQRRATIGDYDDFCRLVQTSSFLDMNGFMMVEPSDVPADTAHLDMLLSGITLCDRAFMGSPVSHQGALDAIEMAGILWGGRERVRNHPVMISLINSLSPLQFAEEMISSLIEFARFGQPCVIAALMMAGSSGPVTMAGVLALQNAEILAGITLAQLVNPGTPVVYGSSSAPMDMRSGALAIEAPEVSRFIAAAAQMARHYGLPSRAGGSLTDAQFPDFQAGSESMLALSTATRCGINFMLHACGILGSYIAMSFEKFLADEEVCGGVKKLVAPVEVGDEAIGLEVIREVGPGGQFLTHEKTFELCRSEFFLPRLASRMGYDEWSTGGRLSTAQRATRLLAERLESYRRPDQDPAVERDLRRYVDLRKNP